MKRPNDITAQLRAEIERRDWHAVHLAADRRPWISNLFPRLGKKSGVGVRVSKGGEKA